MTIKEKVATVLGSAALATGLFTYLAPNEPKHSSSNGTSQSQSANQDADASDAQEKVGEQIRADGNAARDAEHVRKLIPGEYDDIFVHP